MLNNLCIFLVFKRLIKTPLTIQGSSAAELLNSQERGALVKHVLESARAERGDEHALEPALTLRPGQSIGKFFNIRVTCRRVTLTDLASDITSPIKYPHEFSLLK